ncbi:MAG: phosphoribosylanthranilate isomerase [Solirubrobacteraceae bacterium]|nr:phosphoribosylanthranilate isomerase [Solirubrobacteraceae bacterium]
MKVCGIVDRAELEILASADVDLVGLWYGVAGGPHDLSLADFTELASASGPPAAVLVTFSKDVALLSSALKDTAAPWIQLHGYQSPGLVRKLKAEVPDVQVLKVLHVQGGECLEGSLVGSYENNGVDAFLLDVVADDGQVGSTGQAIDPGAAASIASTLNIPFFIAGGISDANRDTYDALAQHPLFLGVDVDTNARDGDGHIDAGRVSAITSAWKGQTHV